MSNFDYIEADHHLNVVDRRSTTFRSEHRYCIKAKSPSRFFIREYGWTGSGSEKEHVPEVVSGIDVWGFPKHRIHGPLLVEDKMRIIVVDLGRTFGVGETETVNFKHKMKDLKGTFGSFVGVRPKKQIKKSLRLSIEIPDWEDLHVYYKMYTRDNDREIDSIRIDPLKSDNGRLYFSKEIIKPDTQNMGHKLQWQHGERWAV